MNAPLPEAPLGGRYRIDHPLRASAMSTVFAATDLTTGARVAVKWLGKPGEPPSDRELARFEQEAKITSALASPHVSRMIDVGRDPKSNVPYLVMDLLPGEDLQTLLDRTGPLADLTAVRIAKQACKGLAAAHAASVVHRDVKPSNLFLRNDGGVIHVVVMDFGVAKIRRDSGLPKALEAPLHSMTRSGDVLGSPLFMSPEQVDSSRRVDARTDIFSLGVTMYAMLSGSAPYAHIYSFVKLLYNIVNHPSPPLLEKAPWVEPSLAAVVDRAMAHDLDLRYPDAKALYAALDGLAVGAPRGGAIDEDMLFGRGAPAPPEPGESPAQTTEERVKEAPSALERLKARFR